MSNITISGARLSEILGINTRYLRELANDEKVKKIGQDVYDLTESISRYIAYKTSDPKNSDDGVTAVEIGDIFGLSERSIRELASKRIVIKIGTGSYDLKESAKNYIEYIKQDKLGEAGQEQLLKKQAERRVAELKLMEAEGKLHRADDIRDFIEDSLIAFRNATRNIPVIVAQALALENNEDKIKAILLAEIDKTLKNLSEYPKELLNGAENSWITNRYI